MVASILIILVSSILLVYWFRYACLLLLRTRAARDYTGSMAAANELRFHEIRGRSIQDAPAGDLPAIQEMLDRDYRLLTYLMRSTASLDVGGATLEERMLMLDFKIMRLVCASSRWLGVNRLRAALEEMSSILGSLANTLGERIDIATQA